MTPAFWICASVCMFALGAYVLQKISFIQVVAVLIMIMVFYWTLPDSTRPKR